MEVVKHGDSGEDADVAASFLLKSGSVFPYLQHRPPQRCKVHAGMGKVHVELAEEGVAIGDDDGDQVDAAFVVVVAIAVGTMRGGHGRVSVNGRCKDKYNFRNLEQCRKKTFVASATVLQCYSSKKCNGKSQRLKLYLYILIYINIKVFLGQKIGKF